MDRFLRIVLLIICLSILPGCSVDTLPIDLEEPPVFQPLPRESEFDAWSRNKLSSISIRSTTRPLPNFREQARIRYSGLDVQGKLVIATDEYTYEVDRPNHISREVEMIDVPERFLSTTKETVVIDKTIYQITHSDLDRQVCQKSMDATPDYVQSFYHNDILLAISPGKQLESNVMLDNVAADVYEIKEVLLDFEAKIEKYGGKVWIARSEPHYFVKAEGTLEGAINLTEKISHGQASFSYQVSALNQVQITYPAACTP